MNNWDFLGKKVFFAGFVDLSLAAIIF